MEVWPRGAEGARHDWSRPASSSTARPSRRASRSAPEAFLGLLKGQQLRQAAGQAGLTRFDGYRMNDIVLHHYADSPFSEKVRLVLGIEGPGLEVGHRAGMLPKPDVVALTGGYRRTPFMQIGADVYCDSRADVPCRRPARAASAALSGLERRSRRHRRAVGRHGAVLDRGAVHDAAGGRRPCVRRCAAGVPEGLPRRPRGDDGRHAPSDAGGCGRAAGELLQLARAPPGARARLAARRRIVHRRLRGRPVDLVHPPGAAGRGAAGTVSAPGRLVRARARARPRPPERAVERRRARDRGRSQGPRRGRRSPTAQAFAAGTDVTVTPTDYAADPVAGRLVGLDRDEVVVARDDARAGRVHVHFPRIGYQVKASRRGHSDHSEASQT